MGSWAGKNVTRRKVEPNVRHSNQLVNERFYLRNRLFDTRRFESPAALGAPYPA